MSTAIPPPPGLGDTHFYGNPQQPEPPGMKVSAPNNSSTSPVNSQPGLLPFPSNLQMQSTMNQQQKVFKQLSPQPQQEDPLPPGLAPAGVSPMAATTQLGISANPTINYPPMGHQQMMSPYGNAMLGAPGLMGPSPAIQMMNPMMQKDENVRRCVHIGNLDSKCPQSQIVSFFGGKCGPLSYIRMAGDEAMPTRFAFIEFVDEIGAIRATELTGEPFADARLKVKPSTNIIVKPPIHVKEDDQLRVAHRLKKMTKKILKVQFPKKRKRSSSGSDEDEAEGHSKNEGEGAEDNNNDRDERRQRHKERRIESTRKATDPVEEEGIEENEEEEDEEKEEREKRQKFKERRKEHREDNYHENDNNNPENDNNQG